MNKTKVVYTCQVCATQYPKWSGRCSDCGSWNSFIEETTKAKNAIRFDRQQGFAGTQSTIIPLTEVNFSEQTCIPTSLTEFDRVLGGGLVPGAVILIGGDPGIGKSTLLLQTVCNLSKQLKSLYITGEESLQQIKLRAHRLELPEDELALLAETNVERIIELAEQQKPAIIVIDSIQTMYTDTLQSAPGSIAQVREATARLVQFAKHTNTTVLLVGHVTKEGALAGPRVLEHMVDTVLYFEGDQGHRYRMLRAIKNRFGAVNELGVFAMVDNGLREVNNPSAIFLSRDNEPAPGSMIMVTWEGSRPMLVEVQALVDESHLANPRRVTVGLDSNRLSMLLAVLHRHGGIASYDQDVFVNVVGGVRINETGADLATVLAILSSLRNYPLPHDLVAFGEIGLAGEIRPVQSGQERLKEAAKHGFKRAIIAKANAPKETIENMEVIAVSRLADALTCFGK